MFLKEFFRSPRKTILEGGNLAAGQPGWKGDLSAGQAQNINLQVTNRSVIIPILNKLLADINSAYQAQYQEPLWDPKLLKSQKFLSGSSLHFFNVKGIPDKTFVEKKPKVGDIDTMVDKEKESNLDSFLEAHLNKKIGDALFLGYQRGNEQFSSLWQLNDPPIKIQIDLEFVAFDKAEPTPWSRFSHSSDWNDLQAGVKGVFHKFLIQSLGVLTKRQFILRKQEGRGKNRVWVDKPEEDSMLSFAVSSKEGGGLRAKYTPVVNPATNEPEMKDGLPVMMAMPASGYEQDIGKIFQSIFGVKMPEKSAKQLADKFWSFTGLLEVMNKLLDPEEKSRVFGSFLNKTFGQGAQGLYKNDPERDSAEKMAAIDLLTKVTGAKPPDGMDIEQMRQTYVSAYKMTEEIVDEADDPTAPSKPNYARQGIQHIYNRLPDGRVSSMEMKDLDFIELCKEIADNGGTLNDVPINLKVDGAGIRFGKDESGRAFFMTSKVTEPLYADNIGYFTNFGVEKGQSGDNLARTKKYDDALALIVNSDFIKTLPADTIVQAEMLYNDMAQNVDGQLKFVNIPYDPKKLGKQMTLVPFMVKQYSTGEELPDQDKVIQRLISSSDKNIKIVTNRLQQNGINVSKIIDPVINMDSSLVSSLNARGANPQKEQAKQILDQARQQLSSAIIDSPKLKGKDALGSNMEGIVVNMPSGRLVKVTSQQMKSAMASKTAPQQFGDTKPRTAVVAIGNFAGHKGHEQLINFAIKKAEEVNGTPFVFVGHKVGPDDPIDINTKLETLKKLFPGVSVSVVENQIDPSGQETAGNIFKKIEYELVKKEPFYNNIIITVGSDQAGIAKTADQMQGRYSKFPPLAHVKVSVYVTPRKSDEGGTGVSTTQLRNALKTMPEDQAFQIWSQAYNVQKLGADWIKHLMDVARKNMGLNKSQPTSTPTQQPAPVTERLFNALIRPRLFENVSAIARLNNIQDINKIQTGQQLKLPNGTVYTVAAGDTLSGIAAGQFKGKSPTTPAAPQTSTGAGRSTGVGGPTAADWGGGNKATSAAKTAPEVPANAVRSSGGTPVRTGSGEILTTKTPAPDPKAVAAAKAKLTPSQLKWLDGADPTDPAIMARMPEPLPGEKTTAPAKSAKPAAGVPSISSDADIMDMVKDHEGVRNKPYKDSKGLWTVGVGHLIGDGKTLPPTWNREFSDSEIMNMFQKDYQHHKAAATKIPGFNNLNTNGQAALIDLTFNMGPTWWQSWPKFTKAMQTGNVNQAANELVNSEWYKQVGRRAPKIVSLLKAGSNTVAENNDPSVRAIQKMLNKKGANLDIDGKMGPLTKKSIKKFLPPADTGSAPDPDKTTAVQGKNVKERMMPASSFAGTPKNKLGSAAHLKGSMKRPAQQGDLVGGMEEARTDEISNATKASYKEKAQAQIKDLKPWTKKGEYKDLAKNAIARREKGLSKLVPVSEDISKIMSSLINEMIKNK